MKNKVTKRKNHIDKKVTENSIYLEKINNISKRISIRPITHQNHKFKMVLIYSITLTNF